MPIKKIPPPPPLPAELQSFNRWLLEIQAVFNAGGFIEPTEIVGLVAAYVQLAQNTADIAALQNEVAALQAALAALALRVTASEAAIAALAVRVTNLEARNQILNGVAVPAGALGAVGDWYSDTVAKHIYVKTAAATWTLIV